MKIKIYIDFDGVIQDTWSIIYKNYKTKYHTNEIVEEDIKKSMLDLGWDFILKNSKEINNSFEKINQLMINYNVYVLTKINSVEEEETKKSFLKRHNIVNVICVPYNSSKTDFVNPNGNILIDDDIYNLEEWKQNGGIPILFNKHMKNIDIYGNKSDKFIIIDDLFKICDIIKNR